jgi:hypothetical protein
MHLQSRACRWQWLWLTAFVWFPTPVVSRQVSRWLLYCCLLGFVMQCEVSSELHNSPAFTAIFQSSSPAALLDRQLLDCKTAAVLPIHHKHRQATPRMATFPAIKSREYWALLVEAPCSGV